MKTLGKLVLSAAIAAVLVAAPVAAIVAKPAAGARAWQIRTADSRKNTGGVGWFDSLELDSSGNPLIAYFDYIDEEHGRLMFTRSGDGGNTWPDADNTTVDSGGSVGWYASLALDSSDNPHVSYLDRDNKTLKYTWSGDGGKTWPAENVRTVDTVGGVIDNGNGRCTSLVLDASDNPRISYFDSDKQELKFARSEDGGDTWPAAQIRTIESGGYSGQWSSLALDSLGNPRVSYSNSPDDDHCDLKFAWSDDGGATWPAAQIRTVVSGGNAGRWNSLALNSSDNPLVGYSDDDDQDLKFARSDDGGATWPAGSVKTVDAGGDVGRYTSLALDSSGNPRISYLDDTNDDLKFARSDDGGATWPAALIKVVDSEGAVGMHTSLALDPEGNPYIGYNRYITEEAGALKFAWSIDGGATWPAAQIRDAVCGEDAGYWTSLALDPSGNPRISYYDNDNGVIKFAWSDDGGATWPAENIRTVDYVGSIGGGYTSLALDTSGNPRISYFDFVNRDLKYAWSDDGGVTWTPTNRRTVDSGGDVGLYTSLALDSSDNPHVSYYDNTSSHLKYARSGDGGATWPAAWIKVVDPAGQAQGGSSLALDFGNPRIAYSASNDGENGALKYAWSDDGGATWPAANTKTVDSRGSAGWFPSLELDSSGDPRISYLASYDYKNGVLKYAWSDDCGATWPATQIRTVDSGGDVGRYNSVALDSNGNPCISYFDDANQDLKCAWSDDGGATWPASHVNTVDSRGSVGAYSSVALDLSGSPRISYYDGGNGALKFAYVPSAPAGGTWYLAEGTNAWGFFTYITIVNPNDTAVRARLTYLCQGPAGSGGPTTRDVTLPPLSQTTVSSYPDIGEVDFSTKVECTDGKPVAVDRTMLWAGQGVEGARSGCHSSIGTTSPAGTWYLPEGSSAWGFETWTLVENPNPRAANVTLTYMTESQGARVLTRTVPACSRASYSMASDIGTADSSIRVSSDMPVIAERSMYSEERREGSCSIGATGPATGYFLAEGATGYDVGFTTYVLVQNPRNGPTDVSITYQTRSGEVDGPSFTMAPASRKTVRLNDQFLADNSVSTRVQGSAPIVAERATYWNNGTGKAFHASIGVSSPHTAFYLPDGQTSDGWETWTLVQNPNRGTVGVRVTYLPQGGGAPVSFTDRVGPGVRATYAMADRLPRGRAAVVVQSLDGARPVIAERAMYRDGRGAGTGTVGGFVD